MGARLRSWWKKTRIPQAVIRLIAVLVVVIALIFVEVRLYGTGFAGKTLWDWLQLAIIPLVLTFGVWWLTRLQQQRDLQLADRRAKSEQETAEKRAQTEREISLDNQHEAALQGYIDNMSALLLKIDLSNPVELDKVRKIARVRTLTVLPRCDGKRKALVLQFLYESDLIDNEGTILNLAGADLSGVHLDKGYMGEIDLHETNLSKAYLDDVILLGANLSKANLLEAHLTGTTLFMANLQEAKLHRADLYRANLCEADLSKADLSEANLQRVDLREAKMTKAILRAADLRGADLSEAILDGAMVTSKQLDEAKSLKGATMPDGSIHP